jgi:hypothetical protein
MRKDLQLRQDSLRQSMICAAKGNQYCTLLAPNQALKLTEWASPAGFTKKQLSAGSYVKHGE